ncbi:hypothetical protein [Clostridium sp.]|uniref:hypothetical protein n=1 Tax=Clostridium sp. TaxID=1506 RepID=UPI00260B4317|nr:hypothetical protein [Clostridium sp.]
MNSKSFKSLINTFGFSIIWFLIASFISLFMVKLNFISNFENVLYIIGLIVFSLGVFSGISGNEIELSLQGITENISQYVYISSINNERLTKEVIHRKLEINYEAVSVSLILGGVLCMVFTKLI